MRIRFAFQASHRPFSCRRSFFCLFTLWLIASSAWGREVNPGKHPEDLLPGGTILFSSIGNLSRALEQADSMPFFRILNEKEVSLFLENHRARIQAYLPPRAMIDRAGIERAFLAVTRVELPGDDAPPGAAPEVGFVIGAECRGDGAGLRTWFERVLSRMAGTDGEPLQAKRGEYKGVAFEEPSLPLPPSMTPRFFSVEGFTLFTLSKTAMEAVVDRSLGASGDTLAKDVGFRETAKTLGFDDPLASKCYVNLRGAVSLCKAWFERREGAALHPERSFECLGLDTLRTWGCSSISRGGKAVVKVHVTSDEPGTGPMGLLPDQPLPEESLRLVPRDALSVSAGHFDWKRFYDLALAFADAVDETWRGKITGFLQEAARKTGGDMEFERDILGAFGTEVFSYKPSPGAGDGAVSLSPIVLCMEVRDGDRIIRFLEAVMENLAKDTADPDSRPVMERVEYRGHEMLVLRKLMKGASPYPLQPAVVKAGRYLAFAYRIEDLERLAERLESPEAPSILENDTMIEARKLLPEDAELLGITYIDVPGYFDNTYDQLLSLASMMDALTRNHEAKGMEPARIPAKECISKHLFGMCILRYRAKGRTFSVQTGPFGSEVTGFPLPSGWLAGFLAAPGPYSFITAGFLLTGLDWRSRKKDQSIILKAEYEEEEIEPLEEEGTRKKKEGKIKRDEDNTRATEKRSDDKESIVSVCNYPNNLLDCAFLLDGAAT